ncbi:MAG TPA: hypothetical protein VGJ91_13185 [Polyangiaceae bacterium]|jgi:hypothetical protein
MTGSHDSADDRRRSRPIAIAFVLLLGSSPGVAHAEPPTNPAPPAATAAPAATESAPVFAYALGAIGLAGISVAGVTGFFAMNQKGVAEDHCSPTLRLCDGAGYQATITGRALRDVSTVAWIVGGVSVGLSAYLLLSAPTRQNQVALSVSVNGASPSAALVAHF